MWLLLFMAQFEQFNFHPWQPCSALGSNLCHLIPGHHLHPKDGQKYHEALFFPETVHLLDLACASCVPVLV